MNNIPPAPRTDAQPVGTNGFSAQAMYRGGATGDGGAAAFHGVLAKADPSRVASVPADTTAGAMSVLGSDSSGHLELHVAAEKGGDKKLGAAAAEEAQRLAHPHRPGPEVAASVNSIQLLNVVVPFPAHLGLEFNQAVPLDSDTGKGIGLTNLSATELASAPSGQPMLGREAGGPVPLRDGAVEAHTVGDPSAAGRFGRVLFAGDIPGQKRPAEATVTPASPSGGRDGSVATAAPSRMAPLLFPAPGQGVAAKMGANGNGNASGKASESNGGPIGQTPPALVPANDQSGMQAANGSFSSGSGPTGKDGTQGKDTASGGSPAKFVEHGLQAAHTVAGNDAAVPGLFGQVAKPPLPGNEAHRSADPSTGRVIDGADRTATSTSSLDPQAIHSARLVQLAGQSEMRLGMHSAEFGDISIQASLVRDRMAAQISVEHGELGKALAIHLPEMQTMLDRDHGMHARIDLRSESGGIGQPGGDPGARGGGQQSPGHGNRGATTTESGPVASGVRSAGRSSGREEPGYEPAGQDWQGQAGTWVGRTGFEADRRLNIRI